MHIKEGCGLTIFTFTGNLILDLIIYQMLKISTPFSVESSMYVHGSVLLYTLRFFYIFDKKVLTRMMIFI